jgi:hypothetical protein
MKSSDFDSTKIWDKELILGFDCVLWGLLIIAMLTFQMWLVAAVKMAIVVYVMAVLAFATVVAQQIPRTFWGQRHLGASLYVVAHVLLLLPGQLPLGAVAFVLIALPIGVVLMFE